MLAPDSVQPFTCLSNAAFKLLEGGKGMRKSSGPWFSDHSSNVEKKGKPQPRKHTPVG